MCFDLKNLTHQAENNTLVGINVGEFTFLANRQSTQLIIACLKTKCYIKKRMSYTN